MRLLFVLALTLVFAVACGGEEEPQGPVDLNVVATVAPTVTLDPGPGRTRIAQATAEAEAVVAVTEAAPTFTPSPSSTPAGSHRGLRPVFRRTPVPAGASGSGAPTSAAPVLEATEEAPLEVPTPVASPTPDPSALVSYANTAFLFGLRVPGDWQNVSSDPALADFVEPDGLAGVFVRYHALPPAYPLEQLRDAVLDEREATWVDVGAAIQGAYAGLGPESFSLAVLNRAQRSADSCVAQFATGFFASEYPERNAAYEASFWVCEGSELVFDQLGLPSFGASGSFPASVFSVCLSYFLTGRRGRSQSKNASSLLVCMKNRPGPSSLHTRPSPERIVLFQLPARPTS